MLQRKSFKCRGLIAALAFLVGAHTASVVHAGIEELEAEILKSNWVGAIELAAPLVDRFPVRARVLTARAYLEIGELDQAHSIASEAIKIAPATRGAHLIRGVALLRQGRFTAAQISVRRALDLSQNDAEKQQAIVILNDIKRVKPWQVQGSLALAPSTNINRATSATTVTGVFGVGTLSGGVQKSGVGLAYSLSARNVISASADHRRSLSFGTAGRLYEDRSLNSSSLWSTLSDDKVRSPSHLFSRAITLKVNRRAQDFDSADLNAAFANTKYPVPGRSNTTTFIVQRSVDFDDFDESSYLVAAQKSVSMGKFSYGGGGYWRDSAAATVGSLGLNVFVDRSLGNWLGWAASARLDLAASRWHEREPLFVEPREDFNVTAGMTFLKQDKSFYGFAPKVTISHNVNRSNISLYSYNATNLTLGIVNSF